MTKVVIMLGRINSSKVYCKCWLKLEIIGLLDDIITNMSEESRYTSYKIDDISYTMRDLVSSKKEKLNNIARLIYVS